MVRRRILTDAKLEAILTFLRAGQWADWAAESAGVKGATLRKARSRDKDLDEILTQAESEAKSNYWKRMANFALTNWLACAWMMERRWHDDFCRPEVRVAKEQLKLAKEQFKAKQGEGVRSAEDQASAIRSFLDEARTAHAGTDTPQPPPNVDPDAEE